MSTRIVKGERVEAPTKERVIKAQSGSQIRCILIEDESKITYEQLRDLVNAKFKQHLDDNYLDFTVSSCYDVYFESFGIFYKDRDGALITIADTSDLQIALKYNQNLTLILKIEKFYEADEYDRYRNKV